MKGHGLALCLRARVGNEGLSSGLAQAWPYIVEGHAYAGPSPSRIRSAGTTCLTTLIREIKCYKKYSLKIINIMF